LHERIGSDEAAEKLGVERAVAEVDGVEVLSLQPGMELEQRRINIGTAEHHSCFTPPL
jgi:hypothetical protein